VRVLVIRHGCAGDKRHWHGPDAERPLDEQGRRQAEALVDVLRDPTIRRIVSSPTARCVESVVPLANAHGLPIEEDERLAPTTSGDQLLALVTKPESADAVLCSHGEVMQEALGALRERGIEIEARDESDDTLLLTKGTGWDLTVEDGEVTALRHLHPDPWLDCTAHAPRPS
jgi:phosphohistidine phosphatase SixA